MCNKKVFGSIGIYGCGKMGRAFYKYVSRFHDYDIVFCLRNMDKAAQLRGKGGSTKPAARFTDRIEDLGGCDIVFEFVPEDIDVKRQVIRRLFEIRKNPLQVLATGSSSFVPGRISEAYDTWNLIGVHYIYPVQIINTVEVVFGEKTPTGLVQGVCRFLRDIGKTPVPMDESIGCISTRVLAVLGNEAFRLHKQYHVPLEKLDDIIDGTGYTPAPFTLNDSVGLDTIYHCLSGHYEYRQEYACFSLLRDFLRKKLELGQLGRKSGEGFYRYRDDDATANSGEEEIPEEIKTEIIERIKTLYINSSFELLDKCYADCGELDRIFCEINGTDNGPAGTLFREGAGAIVEKLKKYAREYGSLFTPLPLLEYAAKYGQGSEDIDKQIRDFNLEGKRPGWYTEDIFRQVMERYVSRGVSIGKQE